MEPNLSDILTGMALVTFVFGLFIVSAIFRIKNSWNALKKESTPKEQRIRKKLDLIFSSIFLIASVVFYSFFLFNMGK